MLRQEAIAVSVTLRILNNHKEIINKLKRAISPHRGEPHKDMIDEKVFFLHGPKQIYTRALALFGPCKYAIA